MSEIMKKSSKFSRIRVMGFGSSLYERVLEDEVILQIVEMRGKEGYLIVEYIDIEKYNKEISNNLKDNLAD